MANPVNRILPVRPQ